jgi:hypothetical protein
VQAAVAHHHLRLADGLQSVRSLIQRCRWNVRVDAGKGGQQAVAQNTCR